MGNRYGLQIRTATAADARGIAELFATSGRILDPRALESRIEAVRATPGALLLADEWGPPSGLVHLAWIPTIGADRPLAVIEFLLVAPDDRRRGIGRTLLKAGSQAARAAGCGDLVLSIAGEIDTLGAFCRATGFDETAREFRRSLRKKS